MHEDGEMPTGHYYKRLFPARRLAEKELEALTEKLVKYF